MQLFRGDIVSMGRFETWPLIWTEAWRHPILGAGVGSAFSFMPTLEPGIYYLHNDYLRVWYECGVVGLTIFMGVLLWQIVHLQRQIARSKGICRCAFTASLLGLLALLIASLTDNTIVYNLWYMNPLFAVMGAAYGVSS